MANKGSRLVVPAAVLSAAALIGVWFPFSTLLGQSAQLSATSQQIAAIQHQSRDLSIQQKLLSTTEAEALLAREEYQLVRPGQRLIQILNNNLSGSQATGDPGFQPLVSPSNAAGLLPVDPSTPPSTVHSPGLWSRVVRTLEFWR